ncbi:beta strand repeat-containing protein, partial [Dyella japonica]
MNKIYRLVRNTATGQWVAASELANGHTKSGNLSRAVKGAVAAAILHLVPVVASAQTTTYTPGTANGESQAIKVNGGTASLDGTISFSGSKSTIQTVYSYINAYNAGYLTGPVDLNGKMTLNMGPQTNGVTVVDPITHGSSVVKTYASGGLSELAPGGLSAITVYSPTPDGQGPFIDATLANVSGGSTFNMNASGQVGDYSTKNTTYIRVADGTANWNSSNTIAFADSASVSPAQVQPYNMTINLSSYAAAPFAVTTADGPQTKTVANLAEFQAYNTWLIGQLQAGKLGSGAAAQTAYNNAIALAYATNGYVYGVTPYTSPISPTDLMLVPNGTEIGMLANGATAVGHVTAGASMTGLWSSRSGTLLQASNGGTIINDGTVTSVRYGTGMSADTGGHLINNGVHNLGGPGTGVVGEVMADTITGTGTTYVNNGTVNQYAWNFSPNGSSNSTGLRIGAGAVGTNNGTMNIGVNSSGGNAQLSVYGVQVDNGGTFLNGANGVMYLGRAASTDTTSDPMARGGADVVQANGMIGINVAAGGAVLNAGTLVTGDKAQNSRGISVSGSNVNVSNTGLIDVKGHYGGAPLANTGIYSTATSGTVNNAGKITLEGVNTIGIQAMSGGKATSNGTINVAGGADPATGLRNYGVWSDGTSSNVKLTGGAVNLVGNGAIGVHARNLGSIDINGGTVNFQSGTQQIGVFAYGAGSVVNINSAPVGGLNVSTDNSTLFRIEDGAKINNNASAPLIASGANSTALDVTGVGSSANLDNMDITVSGQGATALKVEGGATGQMSGAAKLRLKDGATAVVVDNTKYDLSGTAVGSAQSIFTNKATVNVANAKDVTAFVVKNGGKLINTGDIHLSNGTAIEVVGAGSSVVADASGKNGSITVDDGKAGIYVHGGASLTTNDTITVDNGAAGVLVGDDAGKVTIGRNAHMTGKGSSYGNLITNQSPAGNVLVDGATLEMQGSGAALLSENNLDAASHGHVIVSSNVGGKGIALSKADGSRATGSLALGPSWQIDVTGNGSGVYANTTGDLTINGTQLTASGPGVGVKADAANTVTIANGTTLTATNADAVLVTGNPATLNNEGTINAASANATAIHLGDKGTAFANINGGSITGNVVLGNGDNTALLENSTLNGNLSAGSGSVTFTVRGNNVTHGVLDGGIGGNDTLIFDSHDYTADGSNVDQLRNFEKVNLTNASTMTLNRDFAVGDNNNGAGTLSIDGSSALVAQGNYTVHGHVANRGLISLAGADGVPGNVLTVTGNYTGNGGTVELNTVLGGDASPTDKLVVEGDTSGNARLKINGVADTGAHPNNDGIEVVQVGGKSG